MILKSHICIFHSIFRLKFKILTYHSFVTNFIMTFSFSCQNILFIIHKIYSRFIHLYIEQFPLLFHSFIIIIKYCSFIYLESVFIIIFSQQILIEKKFCSRSKNKLGHSLFSIIHHLLLLLLNIYSFEICFNSFKASISRITSFMEQNLSIAHPLKSLHRCVYSARQAGND